LVALAAYAVFVVGWLLARGWMGDSQWQVAILNTFPVLVFAPLPLALVVAVLVRRRAGWALVALPLAVWLALFGWRYLPRTAAAEAAGPELRVMAFNVLYTNRDLNALEAAIAEADPDLIAFSELSPGVHRLLGERLADRYPYRTLRTLTGAWFGNGIYSRWPLEDLGSLQTGRGLRSAAADVQLPTGTVRFVALHPWATAVGERFADIEPGIQQTFRDRDAQVAAVCEYLDAWGDRPVILAGDLNLSEFSDAYRCLGDRLNDGFREVGQGYGNTWPNARNSQWPWRRLGRLPLLARIDYVLHSDHWRAVEAHVPDTAGGSDHRPVVVTLEWVNDPH
jgi:endonuclease/exonuclease/phosphatase (EEP) superfamily protein YafD